MKRILLFITCFLTPLLIFSQNSLTDKIDAGFRKYTSWFVEGIFYEIPITENFQVPWVVIILIGGAIYFTLSFKLINFTGFLSAIKIIRGDYEDIENVGAEYLYKDVKPEDQAAMVKEIRKKKEASGQVSHFQALATAVSATVGLGNIAGVAIAISIGGPGATFWMIIGGLLGMATKFVECTLGVKYREEDEQGRIYGGPMYYLKKGLAEKGFAKIGKILGVIFAVLITIGAFGIGNMFQANQASAQFTELFGGGNSMSLWVGLVLAILVGLVIIGGVKRIAGVTEKVVPFMAGIYVLSALIILGINYQHIGSAVNMIFEGAFTGAGIAGGVVGVMIIGIRRSAFSNEAGVGSSPTAHAAVKTKYPASEGIVALLEPFIDTVVVCTITALIIIITNFDANIVEYGTEITEGVQVTAKAFDSAIPHFSIVLTIAVILFAISTMISWSYYGLQGWMFIFGKNDKARLAYNILFSIFVWIGSAVSLDAVIDFADSMIFAMAVPNVIGIVLLTSVVKKELKKYREAMMLKQKAIANGLKDMNEFIKED